MRRPFCRQSNTLDRSIRTAALTLFLSQASFNLRNRLTNYAVVATKSCTLLVMCQIYEMLCAIWYHLYNLKNEKNTHGGVLLLLKLQVSALHHEFCSRFLNFTIGTISRNTSHTLNRERRESPNSVDTGRKLNVRKTFRRRLGRLLNVLCPFNLRPVSTGKVLVVCQFNRCFSEWMFHTKELNN